MKGPVIGIVIVLALLAAGVIFLAPSVFFPTPAAPLHQSYENDVLGISFTYPPGYVLFESEIGTTTKMHYVITIIRVEDANPPENGEGPTAITLDFYQTAGSLADWLASGTSNVRLGDGVIASTTVSGTSAVHYSWDGLYHGETTALIHAGNVVAVSVTYNDPTDQIRTDYEALLASLELH